MLNPKATRLCASFAATASAPTRRQRTPEKETRIEDFLQVDLCFQEAPVPGVLVCFFIHGERVLGQHVQPPSLAAAGLVPGLAPQPPDHDKNGQQADGSVAIPAGLQPYLQGASVLQVAS